MTEYLTGVPDLEPSDPKKCNWVPIAVIVGIVIALAGSISFLVVLGLQVGDRSGLSDNWTQTLSKSPSATSIGTNLNNLGKFPHIAGSSRNNDVKNALISLYKSYQIPNVWEESHPVLVNYPLSRNVSYFDPATGSTFYAQLFEPVINDGTQAPEEVVATFHGYSPSGNVKGQIVYCNYGTPSDFDYVTNVAGISLSNKIALVRYGHGFRGDKCTLAAERGAIGCLIYSDPNDDGFLLGPVYPDGPYRPEQGVQRGSIWSGSGDPATPGWASTEFAPRLDIQEASNASNPLLTWPLPSIPSQPISYGDARPLLEALTGTTKAPANMSGLITNQNWLPNGYYLGPSNGTLSLDIHNNFETVTVKNVFAKIPGSVEPDRIVLVGCHYDAWTYGGEDPLSGTVAMLEIAKAMGQMYKNGWRPRRTIIFASWDGEEYGMLGSSEWAEKHFNKLSNQLVGYINLDVAVEGKTYFLVGGTPNFQSIISKITSMVSSPPNSGDVTTIHDMWKRAGLDSNGKPIIVPLGAGSDYTAFLQHLGISSAMFTYADHAEYATYHSRYDSPNFVQKFVDPNSFNLHQSIATVTGLLAKSLADSFVIPYDPSIYGSYISTGMYSLKEALLKKNPQAAQLNWSSLQGALDLFTTASNSINSEIDKMNKARSINENALRGLNDRLFLVERTFLNYYGIPGQPWLRHMIYSPGKTDAYSSSMFPTIVNAASSVPFNVQEVQKQIEFVAMHVFAAANYLQPTF